MPTYLVTGASRGIGYGFVKEFASNPENKIIGIVRNKAATEEKVAADGLKNVDLYEADIVDRAALKAVALEVEAKYDSIDYLILNAAYLSQVDALRSLADYSKDPDSYESDFEKSIRVNVIGQIHTINAFISLVQRSSIKKVVAISSGMGDINFVNEIDIDTSVGYSVSKAALNMVMAKYSAIYKSQGVLFLSICPGSVETDGSEMAPTNDTEAAKKQDIGVKFMKYAPNFKGPVTPQESVRDVMKVVYAASIENGSGGDFVSHFGTRRYL